MNPSTASAVLAREQLFEAVVHQSPDGLMVIDSQGIVRFANRTALALFAGTTANLVGYHLGRPAIRKPVEIILLRSHDADSLYVEMRSSEIEWEGSPATLTGPRDLTALKRSEEGLAESERRYRLLADNTLDVIWAVNERLVVIYVNPAIQQLAGYTPAEYVGSSWQDHFVATKLPQVTAWISQEVARGPASPGLTFEIETVRKDGSAVWVEIHGKAIFDGQGAFIGLQGTSRDITERKSASAERDWLVAAMRTTAESITITDPNGVIEYVNPAFEAMTGFSRGEAVGRDHGLLQAGEPQTDFYGTLRKLLADGKSWQGRLVRYRKDGTPFTVEESISPVRGDDGHVAKHVYVMLDLTKGLELEERLRQSYKMESVGRLAGGVAHDFNNMLSVILGNAELALEVLNPADPARGNIEEIVSAGQRSAELTRQLLAFARKQPIEPQVLDINHTVAMMLKLLRRLIGENIDLVWKPSAELWPVKMDPGQVHQILANLLVNARDAIAGTGEIAIETGNMRVAEEVRLDHSVLLPGSYVVLAVRDNGSGIDAATRAKIFEPFFTTKPPGVGTGLGLSTVDGIVHQNQGVIGVSSVMGEGTTFHIYLPRDEGVLDSVEDSGPADRPSTGSETILLVEDEAVLLRFSTQALRTLGYTVLPAGGPTEALRLARQYPGHIDLLLTDVVMPGMSGPDLWRELSGFQGLKCLFASGYNAEAAKGSTLGAGTHLIEKPFRIKALAAKVREVLDS